MHIKQLPKDYAQVLQQIENQGREDFSALAETLQYDRSRLFHIVQSLCHKGLVRCSSQASNEMWLEVSRKGRRLLQYFRPEGRLQHSFSSS